MGGSDDVSSGIVPNFVAFLFFSVLSGFFRSLTFYGKRPD